MFTVYFRFVYFLDPREPAYGHHVGEAGCSRLDHARVDVHI